MNRYRISIPYDYSQFGELTCFVYAEDEQEAEDLATDYSNRHEEDYNDTGTGDSEYDYSNMDIELVEENINQPTQPSQQRQPSSEISHLSLAEQFIPDLIVV